jgi:hypothetical protein
VDETSLKIQPVNLKKKKEEEKKKRSVRTTDNTTPPPQKNIVIFLSPDTAFPSGSVYGTFLLLAHSSSLRSGRQSASHVLLLTIYEQFYS